MIYSVPLSQDFADSLTKFILDQYQSDPFKMANVEIILPTRRACLGLKEAFLRASHEKSLLLPKMTALYDMDNLDENLPPKMPILNRTLLLAKLCMAKPNISSIDKAVMVAIGLGELLDEFYQYETDISHLNTLVQEQQFAEHWNETVEFLDIIHTYWPQILSERGQIDEMDYKIRMIKSYAKKWQQSIPSHPIIMAGFDGAIPAVIELAKVIHTLPQGILFLNGVDTLLTKEEFQRLPTVHPQYPLKRLLDGLNISLDDIIVYGKITPAERLMHETLKPAEETNTWQYIQEIQSDSIKHVTKIITENSAQEALSIALLLRKTLQTPHKTAALVTTDRTLARRVSIEMKRWGIELDDSAGIAFSQTPVGVYLSLLSRLALNPQDGNAWLAVLKHPLAADGGKPSDLRFNIKSAEKTARKKKEKLSYKTQTDLSELFTLFQSNIKTSFSELLKIHIKTAEILATSHDRTGIERLWQDEAGQTIYAFLSELLTFSDLLGEIEPAYYPTVFDLLTASITVRPKYGMHPRLDILGPIEARLHQPDIVIIGGLNEGSFPQLPNAGPWLNRPMRQVLGLPPLENKIAVAAMDFASCFCKKEVYLTRSLKNDGAPTIPSRFLSRLEAVLTAAKIEWPDCEPQITKMLDKPLFNDPVVRPAPKPPVSARPDKLSVTKIELWMRDPYAVYARYILNLYPLDELENPKKHLMFGNGVHDALERFVKEDNHSTDINRLIELGQEMLLLNGFEKGDMAFYMPKFKEIAKWFIAHQSTRIDQIKYSLSEVEGEAVINMLGKGQFTLTAKADRIDVMQDGTVEIIDYKTGSVPSLKEVKAGFAPQLPLEGYILTQGGFKDVNQKYVSDLLYWHLSVKEEKAKLTSLIKNQDEEDIIEDAYKGLQCLISIFNNENTPYESCPAPQKAPRYNDYEHLSRSKEWLNDAEEDTDE